MTTPAPNPPHRPLSLRLRACLIAAALIGGGAFALADHADAKPVIKRSTGALVGMGIDVYIWVHVCDTATRPGTRIRVTAITRTRNGREYARTSTVRRTGPKRCVSVRGEGTEVAVPPRAWNNRVSFIVTNLATGKRAVRNNVRVTST